MLNQYPAGQTGPYTTFDVGAIQITHKYLSGAIQFNSIAFRLASRYHVIGSGYHSPVDVSVSSDGATAWDMSMSSLYSLGCPTRQPLLHRQPRVLLGHCGRL